MLYTNCVAILAVFAQSSFWHLVLVQEKKKKRIIKINIILGQHFMTQPVYIA